jgi:hypothetical protein
MRLFNHASVVYTQELNNPTTRPAGAADGVNAAKGYVRILVRGAVPKDRVYGFGNGKFYGSSILPQQKWMYEGHIAPSWLTAGSYDLVAQYVHDGSVKGESNVIHIDVSQSSDSR